MKISTLRKISKEDLSKTGEPIPKWVDVILDPINELLDNFGTALRSGISVRQNFLSSIIEVTITSGTELEVNPNKKGKILGVIPVFSQGSNATVGLIDSFGYRILNTGNIIIKATFDSAGTRLCRFIVFFDET